MEDQDRAKGGRKTRRRREQPGKQKNGKMEKNHRRSDRNHVTNGRIAFPSKLP